MALTLPAAVARLSREVIETEELIARALAAAAATTATVAQAQVEVAEAPKGAAQHALIRLQKVTASLVAAQSDMLRTHMQLRDIGREIMGPEEDCPDNGFTSAELSDARKVA
ncbi:hypothetical protein K3172_04005 [Qipengyuania sp. 6B39]|uniref:hypothetical protein n=1 Tax=Qipengyuania proteolytica TaxID=2867239 RepID=UPI001C896221|nr:hypothetical protein [Qipengyuania proteolytica]MBX7495019.1 hypothetical protein [Qipengyuania proteolytica]